MKLTLILLVILLTACTAEPTDYPIPGEPEVITVGDITFEMPTQAPEPTLQHYLIAGWARYDPCGNDVQEIGATLIDTDGYSMPDTLLVVCVDGVCKKAITNDIGEVVVEFTRTWGVGSVPWSVCFGDTCLKSSFTGE